MTDFSQAEPSRWTDEDGVLVVPVPTRKRSGVRKLVKDTLRGMSQTVTAVGFCALAASSAPSVEMVQTADFAITVPTSRTVESSTSGDVHPATWGRIIGRMQKWKRVDAPRDFENEPEPFI